MICQFTNHHSLITNHQSLITKKILSLTLRSLAEMDGVVRAVMVTGHTVGTVAVPKRTKTLFYTLLRIGIVASHRYVAQRTDFSAQAARDATVVYCKLLVGNQQAIEQSIGNVGVEARHLATDHINNLLALLDTLCHQRQTLADGIDFATLILRSAECQD